MSSIGDYLLIKKLGKGVFGEVFLAEHKLLKKRFAIKILPKELSSDEAFIKQLNENINVIANLDHPSIIKLHNVSYADSKYFLITDIVVEDNNEICDLVSYLKNKTFPLPENNLEIILRQIALALDYAHEKKINNNEYLVHRGLKLTNILVEKKQDKERFILTDFGLTRLIGDRSYIKKIYKDLIENNASFDQFLNCFHFLSPEQKKGDLDISIKSDIYSFGVLAYFLITEQFPEGFFPLPSDIAKDYTLNWDSFILKCLHKDPSQRPDNLTNAMNNILSKDKNIPSSNIDILSWKEVEKKVKDAMQMSFEFSYNMHSSPDDNVDIQNLPKEEGQLKPIINPKEIERPKYEPDPGAIFQKELNVSYYKPHQEEIKEVEPLLSDMMVIPNGEFIRGSEDGARDESPKHNIKLRSFAIDVHPVINEQFLRFLESMGGEKDANNNDIIKLRHSRIKKVNNKLMIESGYSKHPVVGVTWYGADAYAKWIGKRLPTEAEWEIAVKGKSLDIIYPTGHDIDHSQANFFGSDTTAVKSYPPNEIGMYDMVGNVYEWCADWYAYNYYDISMQTPDYPKGPEQGVYRVLRGGCWKSLKEDLRGSHRHRNNPGTTNSTYGFRCAADVG